MTGRHKLETSRTPWWWFGQPWARPDDDTGWADQEPPDETDEPEPDLEPGTTGLDEDIEREREDTEWMRAMAP